MKKLLTLIFALSVSYALAQDITNHAIPVGGGSGVVGWKTLGPCTSTQIGAWFSGTSADPTCGTISAGMLPGITAGNTSAIVFFSSPTSLSSDPGLIYAAGGGASNLFIGINGSSTGTLNMNTSVGGGAAVRIQNLSTTIGWNLNLPSSAGSSGAPLCSGGGGAVDTTWCTLTVPFGGTGNTSGISGGFPFYNTTTTMGSVTSGTTTTLLHGGGAGGAAPTWSKVTLTTDVSGILPIANGGTNGSNSPTMATNGVVIYDGTRIITDTTSLFTVDYAGQKICIGIGSTCTFAVSILGTVQYGLSSNGQGLRYQTVGADFDLVGINYNNNAFNTLTFSSSGGQTLRINTSSADAILATASTTSLTGALRVTAGGFGLFGALYGGAEIVTGVTVVGSLPACGSATRGARHTVRDSNAASFTAGIGAIVAAGGALVVPVFCDGVNWRIG